MHSTHYFRSNTEQSSNKTSSRHHQAATDQLLFQLVLLGVCLGLALLGVGQVLLQVPELPLELPGELLTRQLLGSQAVTLGVQLLDGLLQAMDL